jgi:hypothetical protein
MIGKCELCEIEEMMLTSHHLTPRMRHNKRVKRDLGKERNKTADLCGPCHSQLHRLFTEKELERDLNTIEKLKANEAVQTWIDWKRKRPNFGKELKVKVKS